MIMSLIIFCFENFHGDTQLAASHMRSAIKVVQQYLADISHSEHNLPLMKSPRPAVLDDELVTLFSRLECNLDIRLDNGVLDSNVDFIAKRPLINVPTHFTDLAEARYYAELLCSAVVPNAPQGQIKDVVLRENPSASTFEGNLLPLETATLSREVTTWFAAFRPLKAHSLTSEGAAEFLPVTIIYIQAIGAALLLRGAAFTSTPYSKFLPEFREIISLSKFVVSHHGFSKSFVFDFGIIPTLFIVLVTCRDTDLRREIVAVLRDMGSRREGMWDGTMMANAGEFLINMDNVNSSEEEDPLTALVRSIGRPPPEDKNIIG